MKALIISITMFAICLVTSVAAEDNMILDYKDVQFFKMNERQRGATISLELSGLAFQSSLAVKNIEANFEGDCIVVLVYLTLAKRGLTGSFDYTLDVPENVDSVYFGTSRQLIWKREK